MRRALLAATLALGCQTKAEPGAPLTPPTVCNGHGELCDRSYTAVAFPGTHNASANIANGFDAPDQTYTMTRQLEDGIRVLHVEIDLYYGDAYFCHSICAIGRQPLVDGFGEVAAFVAAHPDEVVTLLMESNDVTSDTVASALQASGLVPLLHVQPMGSPWPALGDLIEHGDRVVTFLADLTDTGGGSYPYLLDRFGFTWETPWDNQQPSDFARCNADRGTMGNDVYVVDTYLEDQVIPTAAHAALVNDNPFLLDRLQDCQRTTKTFPNFVMVNFYEVGNVFEDVDVLSGFSAIPDADAYAFPPSAWPEGGAPDATTIHDADAADVKDAG